MAQVAFQTGTIRGIRGRILSILTKQPEGVSASFLTLKLGISKRTIYNNLIALQKESKILNCRPIWQLAQTDGYSVRYATSLARNNIELHNLSFVVSLIKKPFWWNNRNAKLMKLKDYQIKQVPWKGQPYLQLMNDDYVIQTYKNSIIIMLRKTYRSNDPYDCLIAGTEDFLRAYSEVERLTGFRFFGDGIPQARIRSQHMVKLQDALAKKCTREGRLFRIDIAGKPRLLIDMSHPRGIEAVSPQYAADDTDRYLRMTEDVITNNPPLPSEMASTLNNVISAQRMITENQQVFDANMKSHIAAIKALAAAVEKLTETVKERK
jgi:hypothetical protein